MFGFNAPQNVWCYAVVLMPYSTCCTLYGDLIVRNLDRSTEVVFIFCAVAKINLKN